MKCSSESIRGSAGSLSECEWSQRHMQIAMTNDVLAELAINTRECDCRHALPESVSEI